MQRILFCSQFPLVRELGAPKVIIELAETMRSLGAQCRLLQPSDLGLQPAGDQHFRRSYSKALRKYIGTHADDFDIVEYDHECLPYARDEFSESCLMVARSVLLVQHLETLRIPTPRNPRAWAGRVVHGRGRARELCERIRWADQTTSQADLVNVSNESDRSELIRRGIQPDRIVVNPFGIATERRRWLELISCDVPAEPVVVFVGTFDYRKGASDLPAIVQIVSGAVPDVRFRLLGTAGLFQSAEQVLKFFPKQLRERISVVPRFEADALPQLLTGSSVGVFPSYYEGFGFGVLEMLAAAIPVIAYDAPGPPMMLSASYLVPPGDVQGLSAKVVELLRNRQQLSDARTEARRLSQPFDWDRIVRATLQAYALARAARQQAVR